MFQFIFQNTFSQPNTTSITPSALWWTYAVAALVLITLLSLVFRKLWRVLHQPDLHEMDRKKIEETWAEIQITADQGVMGAKIAIIEADKLLDSILKSMFIPGETLAERLKVAAYKYPDVRKAWPAHKLRNQLVHDAAFEITVSHVKSSLKDYEAAFRALNVM